MKNEFNPNYVAHPREHFLDWLDENKVDYYGKHFDDWPTGDQFHDILKGNWDGSICDQLQRLTGIKSEIWMRLYIAWVDYKKQVEGE